MGERWVPLLEGDVDPDPVAQFGRWFAGAARVAASPEAMALASVGADGRPSVRMVLLKAWGPDGFVFHTNYAGRKSRELAAHPHPALLFYCEPLGRQRGPRAWDQSAVIDSRASLDKRARQVEAEFAGLPVPRPPGFGGLRVRP